MLLYLFSPIHSIHMPSHNGQTSPSWFHDVESCCALMLVFVQCFSRFHFFRCCSLMMSGLGCLFWTFCRQLIDKRRKTTSFFVCCSFWFQSPKQHLCLLLYVCRIYFLFHSINADSKSDCCKIHFHCIMLKNLTDHQTAVIAILNWFCIL